MWKSRIWKISRIWKLNIIHYIVQLSVEENSYVVEHIKSIHILTSLIPVNSETTDF